MKRRILIIVENLPVPFDGRVWKEATALREANYDVVVLCPRGKGYERGYELLEGVHIYRHPAAKERNGVLGYLWEYGCALLWEMLYSWWIYIRVGFQVIQGCNPPDNIFLVVIPFKLLGVDYIFDQHDLGPELYLSKYEVKNILYRIQAWLEKMTFRFSDVVMSTNNSYRDIAMKRGGISSKDIFVVRNGPDLKKFQPVVPNPSRKAGRSYLVGYVGNMSIQEGLEILLEVAQYIKDVGRRDVYFICIGGGPGLASLRAMVQDKQLGDTVNFTGRVSDAELLEILSTADICVNPDRPCAMNDLSTMIKIMEYMALGKPIVQFDLKEGKYSAQAASLYCDPNNPVADFANKIIWLLDHPEERERMGQVGLARVRKELAWEHSIGNLLAAYERVFAKRRVKRALQGEPARS